MANQVVCTISGGRDGVEIKHVEVLSGTSEGSYLSVLSEKLATLRNCVNICLSELVDKEKALLANGSRKYDDMSDSGSV